MAACWSCGRDREGQPVIDFSEEESNPFESCPQCGYDLRGSLEAEVCPECGFQLKLNEMQKELYWVPSTTKTSALARLFRNPLRMIPIALFAWLFFGFFYQAGEVFSLDVFAFTFFVAALFLTLAAMGGIMVQGLQPSDEQTTEASMTVGNGFILRWLTRGWGRLLFWLAWGCLLIGILMFYLT